MRGTLASLAALMAGLALLGSGCGEGSDPLASMAAGRGRVLLGPELGRLAGAPVEGAELLRWDGAPSRVREALGGEDGEAAAEALREADLRAVLLRPVAAPNGKQGDEAPQVIERLRRWRHVEGLRGLLLSPEGLLVGPAEVHRPRGREREVIGQVARGILEGRRPPRVTSFPEPWRRIRTSEVMVAVRTREGTLRLWRSARASSMARALLTAASVARQRWMEREEALGGPIEEVLPSMRVEVSLLFDDGTLVEPSAAFVDRAVTEEHGVGFEQGGGWHYVLPEARGGERPFEALLGLLERRGMGRGALGRSDVRVYRFVVVPLASSPPDALLP